MSPYEISVEARKISDPVKRAAYVAEACISDAALSAQVEALLSGPVNGETQELHTGGEHWSRIEHYFDQLHALPQEERQARLAGITDAGVREEVASLLKHADGGQTLEGVIGTVAARISEGDRQIGPYEVIRQLGEGGMGVVYLARQERPLRRDVALKVIKPGMDSRQIVARFEAERQSLALMEHPNIARVLDAGETSSGRPYFVMELVEGVPITQYCDTHNLTLRDRLDLFAAVCRAIQHAHQKGIIHRDIKPSNILVAVHDGKPVPKVIDFGIAKAMGQGMSDMSRFTNVGSIVGTLEYMSPEQAEGGGQDVDTRADVYSLGAVLYELLTGATPLEGTEAVKATYLELLRRIREEEPAAPSSRVRSTAVGTLSEVSSRRRTDPGRLSRILSGELDWIVMKALDKNRERRYETANALVRDVERYLSGEPVEAGPPSAAYRWKKIARKYRAALLASAAFLLLLIVAVVATTWQAVRANRAEQTARAVNAFLEQDLLEQASSSRQGGKPDPDIRVRTLLDRAALSIPGKFAHQPRVEASLRRTIGRTYVELGLFPEARTQLERAAQVLKGVTSPNDREQLAAASALASLDWSQGKFADAEKAFVGLAEAERRFLGPTDPDTLDTMDMLAATYNSGAKFPEAEKLLNEIVALRRKANLSGGSGGLTTLMNLGTLYRDQGKFPQAEQIALQALELARRELGTDHPETLIAMSGLGEDYRLQGRYPEAEKLIAQLLEARRKVLGNDHAGTVTSANNLASIYFLEGKYAEAETIYRQVVDSDRKLYGPDHSDTIAAVNNTAWSLYAQSKFAEARPLSQDVFDRLTRTLGREHWRTQMATDLLGAEYAMSGDLVKAEAIHSESLELSKRVQGPTHPNTLQTMNRLATVYRLEGKLARAENLQRQVLDGLRKAVGPEHPNAMIAGGNLGLLYHLQRKDAEAEALLRPVLEVQRRKFPDTWQRFRAEAILGASLMGQHKLAEAKPLLESGYRGMMERQTKIPSESRFNLEYAARWLAESRP